MSGVYAHLPHDSIAYMIDNTYHALLSQVQACTLCASHLPHGTRPVVQIHPQAKILIAGQAPGRKVHATGIPFDDASGQRLRQWMGIDRDVFYNPAHIAILPMGFCYPGTGKSGDLPPRPECAPKWRSTLLNAMQHINLTLVIGHYAQAWHLRGRQQKTLTATVQAWHDYLPNMPLPHPSPRNNIWMQKNPWFEQEVVPALQKKVQEILSSKF